MLVSQAEYARLRGVSRQYVGQMVAKGVIRLTGRKVNTDQADAALAAVREPVRPKRRGQPAAAVPDVPAPSRGDLPTLLLKTRIKSEVERAKLLEIKARVEAGKYVDADDVKVAAFNRARVVRDALLNIPERLAAVLAAETDKERVHGMLTAEIRAACEELSGDSKRG
jgi:PHD/YefM family antitoxin component YafN of YafNO toxin-antitoxin module